MDATLQAEKREGRGKNEARRLRARGRIPAVVYGEGLEPLPIAVEAKSFRTAVSGDQGINSLIELDADGKKFLVMARDIQLRHVATRHYPSGLVQSEYLISA